METLLYTLYETPWWVYILFFYLMAIGWKASKRSTLHLSKFYVLPVLFGAWTIMKILDLPKESVDISELSIGLFIIGGILGWLSGKQSNLTIEKNNRVSIPGSYNVLIAILLIFSVKYYIGYQMGVVKLPEEIFKYHVYDIATSSLITSYFLLRALCYTYRYRKAKDSH